MFRYWRKKKSVASAAHKRDGFDYVGFAILFRRLRRPLLDQHAQFASGLFRILHPCMPLLMKGDMCPGGVHLYSVEACNLTLDPILSL